MGVINITPNSFSDGNIYNQREQFLKQFHSFIKSEFAIDIGAESTAPMNTSISVEEECIRFEQLLDEEFLTSLSSPKVLSVDTYRLETFSYVYKRLRPSFLNTKFIWNDVSGVLDDELDIFIKDFPHCSYVYCQNFSTKRETGAAHMQNTQDISLNDFLSEVMKDMKQAISFFDKRAAKDRLILDPCFGFAKTREQNLYLLDKLAFMIESLKHDSWLIGISRKSFLREPPSMDVKLNTNQLILDEKQFLILQNLLMKTNQKTYYLRAHNPNSLINL